MVRRFAAPLLAAGLCAALAATVWALVFHTGLGRAADQAAFEGFIQLQSTAAAPVASAVAALCNPYPYAVLAAVVIAVALAVHGGRRALVVTAILAAANLVTQWLKPALAAPRMDGPLPSGEQVVAASWPSGHATAAMALALCAVLAVPPAWRLVTAVAGGLFAIAIAYSVVLLGWHMPSDALGGFAVAGAAAGLGVAALRAAEAGWPAGTARRAATRALGHVHAPGTAGAAVLAALVVIGLAVVRVSGALPGPQERLAFLAVAASIVGLGLTLAGVAAGSGGGGRR
jgi:membrane-associated phospholipid phosphatase